MVENASRKVSDNKVQALRSTFRQYINNEYAHFKDKSIIISDAFYPYRYDIGIDLWDALVGEESMYRCHELLEVHFTKTGKVKSPLRNSHVYMRSIKILKEFIDTTYGGVDAFLQLQPDEIEGQHSTINEAKKPASIRTNRKSNPDVPRPSCDEVKKYLSRWDTLENYALQESALDKLFFKAYPDNTDIDDVLIKVSALN